MKLSFEKKYYYGDIPDGAGGGPEKTAAFTGEADGSRNTKPGLPADPSSGEKGEAPGKPAVSERAGILPDKADTTGRQGPPEAPHARETEWPIWEVFIRSKQGLDHKHAGSLHAADAAMAIENARDVYTRRQEGISIWVVESRYVHASSPEDAGSLYDPANDKIYRHPTFYNLPDELTHI